MTTTTTASDATNESHFDYAAVPLFGYSTDAGFGFGLRGIVQRVAPDVQPYLFDLEVQGMATTGGAQFHFLSLDVPRIFGTRFRFDLLGGYYRNVASPFYGIGNHAAPSADVPDGYYLYDEETPLVRARVRGALTEHLSLIVGYRFLWESIRFAPTSLVAADLPFGSSGGRFSELAVGLAWDTRDREFAPSDGVLIEATARTTQGFIGSSTSSYGLFLTGSLYQTIVGDLVFAGRAAIDALWGDVPFDRMQDFGSLITPFFILGGVGGGVSVRGLVQSEYIGNTKAIANAELRYPLFTVTLFSKPATLSSVAFVDAGRVWSQQDTPNLPAWGVHFGVGGGLRIAWGETFLVRADAGFAEGQVRFYADFRHAF